MRFRGAYARHTAAKALTPQKCFSWLGLGNFISLMQNSATKRERFNGGGYLDRFSQSLRRRARDRSS
jgi:hypothetical protein